MKCENCGTECEIKYGSGRFCSSKCARGYSTKAQRCEINKKVSKKLQGKPTWIKGTKGKGNSGYTIDRSVETEHRWKFGSWENVPLKKRRARILLEQNGLCAICASPPVWLGKPLSFELDHVSGKREDNSRENLRMLCPNCHRQTSTWGQKNASPDGRIRMLAGGVKWMK